MADHRKEQGAVALETALVLSVVLMLVVGGFTLAHAMVTRATVSSAVYDAARSCTLNGTPNGACAQQAVRQAMGGLANWCDPLNVRARVDRLLANSSRLRSRPRAPTRTPSRA